MSPIAPLKTTETKVTDAMYEVTEEDGKRVIVNNNPSLLTCARMRQQLNFEMREGHTIRISICEIAFTVYYLQG